MAFITNLVRILSGTLFIISGLIKANDPIGFGIKLEEYFTVFGTEFMIPLATGLAVFVCVAEIALGVALLLGYKKKLTLWLIMLMMIFFTFLTFYSAYFNKVTDCGCFGDAVKLTPWQSFGKDVVLVILTLIMFAGAKYIRPIFVTRINAGFVWLSVLASTLFGLYCYQYLPLKDFRPYAVGNNILELSQVPEGAPVDSFEIIWTYKVDGVERVFAQSEEPWNIEGAEYVDRKEKLVRKGYVPPIHDFSISDFQQNDYTEDFLVAPYAMFIVTHKTEKARSASFPEVNNIAKWAMEKDIRVAGLSASTPLDTRAYSVVRANPYESYITDATTLKTMIRSNPGVILLRKGTILGKWPSTALPSTEELNGLL